MNSPSESLLDDCESLVSEYWFSPGSTDGNTPITVATCGLLGCVVCVDVPSAVGMLLVSGSTLVWVFGDDELDGSTAGNIHYILSLVKITNDPINAQLRSGICDLS